MHERYEFTKEIHVYDQNVGNLSLTLKEHVEEFKGPVHHRIVCL